MTPSPCQKSFVKVFISSEKVQAHAEYLGFYCYNTFMDNDILKATELPIYRASQPWNDPWWHEDRVYDKIQHYLTLATPLNILKYPKKDMHTKTSLSSMQYGG